MISPVLEAWERYHWGAIHAYLEREGRRAGFAVIDPLAGWRESEDPRSLRIHGDNLHYDERGNGVFGRFMATAVRDALEARFGPAEQAHLGWVPQATVPVDDDKAEVLFKLIEQLDGNDDVQRVIGNFEVSDAALARLHA